MVRGSQDTEGGGEMMDKLPKDIRDGIEPLGLDYNHTLQILLTWRKLKEYAKLGLIDYAYRSDTGRHYNIDNFSARKKRMERHYRELQPFIHCLSVEEHNEPFLSIPHPSKILKTLENKLPENQKREALSALTGKGRLEGRTRREKDDEEQISRINKAIIDGATLPSKNSK